MSMSLEFGRNGMEGLREETDEKIYGDPRSRTPYESEEEIKERQRVLIEGLTPPEDADKEQIFKAMEEVRKAARADYSHRLSDDETTVRQDYSGVTEYGQDTVDRASDNLNLTGDKFMNAVAELRAKAEQEKAIRIAEDSRNEELDELTRQEWEEAQRRAMEEYQAARLEYDSAIRSSLLQRGIGSTFDESELGGYDSSNRVR